MNQKFYPLTSYVPNQRWIQIILFDDFHNFIQLSLKLPKILFNLLKQRNYWNCADRISRELRINAKQKIRSFFYINSILARNIRFSFARHFSTKPLLFPTTKLIFDQCRQRVLIYVPRIILHAQRREQKPTIYFSFIHRDISV